MRALAIALATTACTQVTSDFVCSTDADCGSLVCDASRPAPYCVSPTCGG